ncbi:hypothetical protein [Alloactinosynnema sp. L-07]|uniref:DUF6086 family protein n=1 Tax=Alloactinosynnema sp. L-07 TaxID=1653480 RepID=UPI00065F0599|nr:DUF6086 family protein [Alloactinosynnema sp. L-07]CRK58254.1 hypothetical protein [Alloactinosynnema sp. L-07]
MSYTFEVGRETVWDPALRIGQLYLSLADAAGERFGVPSGLTPRADGTCAVDVPVFRRFVEAMIEVHASTRHPVMHGLFRGVLLASLVMLERADGELVAKSEQEQALLVEAREFGRSM